MCEFVRVLHRIYRELTNCFPQDPSSPLLASDEAFQLYLFSLVNSGQQASVHAAANKRDTLLASVNASQTPDKHLPNVPRPQSESHVSQNGDTSQPQSASQQLAQATLAGQAHSDGSSPPPPPLSGSNPLSSGTLDNPVQVTIVERQSENHSPNFVVLTGRRERCLGTKTYPFSSRPLCRLLLYVYFPAQRSYSSFTKSVFLVILSVLFENSGIMKAGGASQTQFEPSDGKVVKFSDVHGVDEAKDELADVVEFLKNPSSFSSLGGKLPKGILLTGSVE